MPKTEERPQQKTEKLQREELLHEVASPDAPFQVAMGLFRARILEKLQQLFCALSTHPNNQTPLPNVLSFKAAFSYIVSGIPKPQDQGERYSQNWNDYNRRAYTTDQLIYRFCSPDKAAALIKPEMLARSSIIQYFRGGPLPKINKSDFKSIPWVAVLADIWDNANIDTKTIGERLATLDILSDSERRKLTKALGLKKIIKKDLPLQVAFSQVCDIKALDIISPQTSESNNTLHLFKKQLPKELHQHIDTQGRFIIHSVTQLDEPGKFELVISTVGIPSAQHKIQLWGFTSSESCMLERYSPVPEGTWSNMLNIAFSGLTVEEKIAVSCLAPKLSNSTANEKFKTAEHLLYQALMAYLASDYISSKIIAKFIKNPENIEMLVEPFAKALADTDTPSDPDSIINDLTDALEDVTLKDTDFPSQLLSQLMTIKDSITKKVTTWKQLRRKSIVDPTATSLAFQVAKVTLTYNQTNLDWEDSSGPKSEGVPIYSPSSLPASQRSALLSTGCPEYIVHPFESLINDLDKNPLTTSGRAIFSGLSHTSLPEHAFPIAWQGFQTSACSAFDDFYNDLIPSNYADIPTQTKSLEEFKGLNALCDHLIDHNISSLSEVLRTASKEIARKTIFCAIPDLYPLIYFAEKYHADQYIENLCRSTKHQSERHFEELRRQGYRMTGENLSPKATKQLMALATIIPPDLLERIANQRLKEERTGSQRDHLQRESLWLKRIRMVWGLLQIPGSTPFDLQSGIPSFVLRNTGIIKEKARFNTIIANTVKSELQKKYPGIYLEPEFLKILLPQDFTLQKTTHQLPRLASATSLGSWISLLSHLNSTPILLSHLNSTPILLSHLNSTPKPSIYACKLTEDIWIEATDFSGDAPPIVQSPGTHEVLTPRTRRIPTKEQLTLVKTLAKYREFCGLVDHNKRRPSSSYVQIEGLSGTIKNAVSYFFSFFGSPAKTPEPSAAIDSEALISQLIHGHAIRPNPPQTSSRRQLLF